MGGGAEVCHNSRVAFAALLDELELSLLVSARGIGAVVAIGADATRVTPFDAPSSVATDGDRLVIGTRHALLEYRRRESGFRMHTSHVTGDLGTRDVQIGSNGRVWLVNTRLSCLATIDGDDAAPAWHPPFITALAPEDRCHLSGLAMVGGEPRFVTAFAETDTPAGWRASGSGAGVVMEVPSGEVVAAGLSMPHSPRWHDGRLWVLASGARSLVSIDIATGAVHAVGEVPGFPRGLAFAGHHAFVGASAARGRPETSSVRVLDVRDGRTVASLPLRHAVREILDVRTLAVREVRIED